MKYLAKRLNVLMDLWGGAISIREAVQLPLNRKTSGSHSRILCEYVQIVEMVGVQSAALHPIYFIYKIPFL